MSNLSNADWMFGSAGQISYSGAINLSNISAKGFTFVQSFLELFESVFWQTLFHYGLTKNVSSKNAC